MAIRCQRNFTKWRRGSPGWILPSKRKNPGSANSSRSKAENLRHFLWRTHGRLSAVSLPQRRLVRANPCKYAFESLINCHRGFPIYGLRGFPVVGKINRQIGFANRVFRGDRGPVAELLL